MHVRPVSCEEMTLHYGKEKSFGAAVQKVRNAVGLQSFHAQG